MYLEGFQDVLVIITYGLAIVILSIVADRKNRNPLAWVLIGGLFFPCSLLYLAFLPRLCPKCKDEWKGRTYPNCDAVPKRVEYYSTAGNEEGGVHDGILGRGGMNVSYVDTLMEPQLHKPNGVLQPGRRMGVSPDTRRIHTGALP
jgi:hypothetical protein